MIPPRRRRKFRMLDERNQPEGTIFGKDIVAPVVTAFAIPEDSYSRTVLVTTFTAYDYQGPIWYMITESATAPLPTDPGWTSTPPIYFTFSGDGTQTAFAWAKDDAGNVSASASASVEITPPPTFAEFRDALSYRLDRATSPIFTAGEFAWDVADPYYGHMSMMRDPADPTRILLWWLSWGPGPDTQSRIVFATAPASSDLSLRASWTVYAGNPVFVESTPEAWDDEYLGYNRTVYNPTTQKYHLYYWASTSDFYHRQIGLATADNPQGPYTRHPGNPVIGPIDGWGVSGEYDIEAGDFIRLDDGTWRAIINVGSGPTANGQVFRVFTSNDGITWTRAGLDALAAVAGDYLEYNTIVRCSDGWALLYEVLAGGTDWRHKLAGPVASLDTASWPAAIDLVLTEAPGSAWDSTEVGTPRVFSVDNETYYYLYQGRLDDRWHLGVGKFVIGESVTFSDPFTGTDGAALNSTNWNAATGGTGTGIDIRSNRATVLGTEQGAIEVVSKIDLPWKGGAFIEADCGWTTTFSSSAYWQVGWQRADCVGTDRNRTRIAFNNDTIAAYSWDDAGSYMGSIWFQGGLSAPPFTLKIRFNDPGATGTPATYDVLIDGVAVRSGVAFDWAASGPVRPLLLGYQGGNLNPIWFDNVRAGRG